MLGSYTRDIHMQYSDLQAEQESYRSLRARITNLTGLHITLTYHGRGGSRSWRHMPGGYIFITYLMTAFHVKQCYYRNIDKETVAVTDLFRGDIA
jgi:hypothetical protein